jgi:hypothetical protein
MPFFNYGGAIADNSEIANKLNEHLQNQATLTKVSHIQYRESIERIENVLPVSISKVNMVLKLPETADA